MSEILERILQHKRDEVSAASSAVAAADLRRSSELRRGRRRDFVAALQRAVVAGRPGVIAEAKKASPSAGLLREDYRPAALAEEYSSHGASCLSVLTDRDFFQGAAEHLQAAREACSLPVLRKDFIVDEYQVWESGAWGADCLLLIAAAFVGDWQRMSALASLAREHGMAVLLELHSAAELESLAVAEVDLVGINNRDLRSFRTDLQISLDLVRQLPPNIPVVSESGIRTPEDVARLRDNGIERFLVGEALMRAASPGQALAELFGGQPSAAGTANSANRGD